MESDNISEAKTEDLAKKEPVEQLPQFLQTFRDDIKLFIERSAEDYQRLSGDIRALKETIEAAMLLEREKIALFVDSQNLYYSARTGYAAKVNYEKLLRLIVQNRNLVKAYAYIVQPPDGDVKPFATSLERIGYIVKIKDVRTRANGSAKANWDMGIALDILGILDRVDTIVLASGDGDFVPLVDFIKAKNKRVEIFAFAENTAYDLKEKADHFEPLGENIILT